MTVDINGIINGLGKNYQELTEDGLITYKSSPVASSGDPDLSLNMAKEGLFLSFKREGRILQAIVLKIQNDKVRDWMFPNELPSPLQKEMSRQWVHENLGLPLRSLPPQVIMRRAFGWTDLYEAKGRSISTSMQTSYDVMNKVRAITFVPTAELRW